jgi:hypothetical protein
MRQSHWVLVLALAVAIPFTCAGVAFLAFVGAPFLMSWIYTVGRLPAVQAEDVYASAEDGMRAVIARSYVQPEDVEIVYAGTNSFDGSDPHVWYVIACVRGGRRADGSPVGSRVHDYDQPGLFFLNTVEGWVHVPEGAFPELVGFWMKVYGLAGPGAARPTHERGSSPGARCAF